MADTADLVVLGAYFGTGSKGILYITLLSCIVSIMLAEVGHPICRNWLLSFRKILFFFLYQNRSEKIYTFILFQ